MSQGSGTFPLWDERNPRFTQVTERAKVQAYLDRIRGNQPARVHGPGTPVEQVTRGNELVWVLPDGDRHERRVQRAILSDQDRLFWVTLAVACGRPGLSDRDGSPALAKEFGVLAKARHDLDALYQYYRPTQIGDPRQIVPGSPGLGKSPGYFDRAISLDNPSLAQLEDAVRKVSQWLAINQTDPEYASFQLNFFFSGHGVLRDSSGAGLALADAIVDAGDLATALLDCIPDTEVAPSRCRLDLFLDCCHSTAVARSLTKELARAQSREQPAIRSTLEPGQVFCACLDDEEAYELSKLPHSVFTFAFLNECSRMRPDGADAVNLGLRDVGWYTGGRQHPLLLDFTSDEGTEVKFPSSFYVSRSPEAKAHWEAVARTASSRPWDPGDPLLLPAEMAQTQRAACREVEQEWAVRPDIRVPYSRDEALTNRKFPFL